MTKFSRPRSWVEHRLADELSVDGVAYTVDLVARRGTGVAGYRVSAVFMPHDTSAGSELEAPLPSAATTTEIHQQVRELSGQTERLATLLREAKES